VRDRVLYTPTLGLGVLAGVTRSVLMELAPELGFDVREVSAPRSELDGAQELFATMTSVGIVSIRELDGRTLPERGAADLLREAYWNVVDREGAQRE
jgi:branched-chain amino acid aminotransferase